MKYHVRCFLCKTELRETRDIHESYQGGICITCSFKELLGVAKRIAFKDGHERMIGSETAQDREALKTAIAQAEKVKL